MKIGVTGPRGRLGSHLVSLGCQPIECDISKFSEVEKAMASTGIEALINCAAWTAVDEAEKAENKERVLSVNMSGPAILRKYFSGLLVQISTGFVFDGKDGPYDEEAEPHPVNWYGWTKWGGEITATLREPTLIVRVLDLFGSEAKPDFVDAMVRSLESGNRYELPDNLNKSPTYIPHLAEALLLAVHMGLTGIVNISGNKVMSTYRWGRKIAEYFGYDPDILQPTDEVRGLAPRPLRGGLIVDRARELGLPIYSPLDGLAILAERRNDSP